MAPYAVAALVGLRDRLPLMGEYVAWARSFAALLTADGFRIAPEVPHTNTFLVHAPGEVDAVNGRLAAFMERTLIEPSRPWRAADVPGWVVAEIAVQSDALDHDPATVAGWWREVVHG